MNPWAAYASLLSRADIYIRNIKGFNTSPYNQHQITRINSRGMNYEQLLVMNWERFVCDKTGIELVIASRASIPLIQ